MQNRENFILLGVNTIIIVLVLIVLFRMYDKKMKTYIKKIEKNLDICINNYHKSQISQMKLPNIMTPYISSQHISNINQQNPQNLQNQQNIQQHILPSQPINNLINDDKDNKDNTNELMNDIDSYIDPMKDE